MTQPHLRRFTN